MRAFLRDAERCEVIAYERNPEERFPLKKLSDTGLFEGFLKGERARFPYRLRVVQGNGEIRQFYDPYAFGPTIGEEDLYLFNEGSEHRIYRKFGSHLREIDGVSGVSFVVWAPGARRVSVVGDFNCWDGRYLPMRPLGSSGVWEIFIPGLERGLKYKFEIHGADDYLHLKTDPYGTSFEAPPHNASIIYPVDDVYRWGDDAWMRERSESDWANRPMSIYEVHLGSWKRRREDGNRPYTYREAAAELVEYVNKMGYTHVEFMPLAEHPYSGSWGYQVTGFFAPTHRFGEPEDFMHLVDQLHQNGIGVILDWVPGHFPKDAFALARFDGSHLYEHEDPRQGLHLDWGTLIFNYGRHEVRGFLIANALAWFDRYHIDGLRVDAVASMIYLDYSREDGAWIPNRHGGRENFEAIAFLRQANQLAHEYYPGVMMIAEESTSFGGVTRPASEGGLGYDLKWNMGWMNDTLSYFGKDPLYRKWHHNLLTFGMIYQYSERFVQVFSHDEVVHGKASMLMKMAAESITEKAGTLRALYALMWMWPGKKTLFMGCDFGQSREWSYDRSLDWDLLQYIDHQGIQYIIQDLNALYRCDPALHEGELEEGGFEWVALDDADSSVIAFLRRDRNRTVHYLVLGHYTPLTREHYRVGVPFGGFWREVINSDADLYGGSGAGNLGGKEAEPVRCDNHVYSLDLTVPGNTTLVFKHEPR